MFDEKSLGLFSYESNFRKSVVFLTEWKRFDQIIIGLILVGSIMQAAYDYSDLNNQTLYNQRIENVTNLITFFFIAEAILKMIA